MQTLRGEGTAWVRSVFRGVSKVCGTPLEFPSLSYRSNETRTSKFVWLVCALGDAEGYVRVLGGAELEGRGWVHARRGGTGCMLGGD